MKELSFLFWIAGVNLFSSSPNFRAILNVMRIFFALLILGFFWLLGLCILQQT